MCDAPSILSIPLMRFHTKGREINKKTDYPTEVRIPEYSSGNDQQTRANIKYHLCSVIVHEGNHITSGHYVCYIKKNGNWFYASDEIVKVSSPMVATNQDAYILFYETNVDQETFKQNKTL